MFMISSRDTSGLPDIEKLMHLMQSLAVLDAILSPEWEYRYYSFNSKWDENEAMASMRNGCGDEFFMLFNAAGCIIKGFDHESPMNLFGEKPSRIWPGVLDSVPDVFSSFLQEPAFEIQVTTFCLWRTKASQRWECGNIDYPSSDDPDGSESLLYILDRDPETYKEFAESYYTLNHAQRDFRIETIAYIYEHRELTQETVFELNPDISLESLAKDLDEIGYRTFSIFQ
jgi:hypothetical protein